MSPFFIFVLGISLLFAGFLALMDYCYQAANKLQLELEGRLGGTTGRILGFFAKRPLWFLGTTLVGTTVSLVTFTAVFCIASTPVLRPYLPAPWYGSLLLFAIQSVLAGIILAFVVVVLPRMLRVFDPNRILSATALPFFACFILCVPFTWPFLMISRYITVHLLHIRHDELRPFLVTPARQQHTASVASSDDEALIDDKMLQNALAFKTVKIRDCMVPRTEITAIELGENVEKLRHTFIESGHSKVLVYKHNIDEIVGYCHSSSMFRRPQEIREILTPVIISAETNSANELMIRFIREKKSLAVVIDEFGGTSGVVTMEDIIEEIFGRIDDEHDPDDDLIEQQIAPSTYLLSARIEIDHINETYGWNLPTGEYETLGGLILAHTEDFPKPGHVVRIPGFTFTIRASEKNRIGQVVVVVEEQP